jgi:hypothetical protein
LVDSGGQLSTVEGAAKVHGEYIELEGPHTDLELVSALVRLLDPAWIDWGIAGYPTLTLADNRTVVIVDFDPGGGAGPTLAIGNIDNDDRACRAAARSVYRAVLGDTDWRARWTYDTPEGEVLHDLWPENHADTAPGSERCSRPRELPRSRVPPDRAAG